jgi:hypothetical protein
VQVNEHHRRLQLATRSIGATKPAPPCAGAALTGLARRSKSCHKLTFVRPGANQRRTNMPATYGRCLAERESASAPYPLFNQVI